LRRRKSVLEKKGGYRGDKLEAVPKAGSNRKEREKKISNRTSIISELHPVKGNGPSCERACPFRKVSYHRTRRPEGRGRKRGWKTEDRTFRKALF